MALGCGLTFVRGSRGVNYEKFTTVSPKTCKEKKEVSQKIVHFIDTYPFYSRYIYKYVDLHIYDKYMDKSYSPVFLLPKRPLSVRETCIPFFFFFFFFSLSLNFLLQFT
jgi:hypothetical protein